MEDLLKLPELRQSATLLAPGPAGRIEVLVAMPEAPPAAIAVICHPHPLHGGALSNKVTYQLAATALKAGCAAARFNFRGVGKSEGTHDEGRGEADDTLVVVDFMRQRLPGLPLLLAGFSFGAYVSLSAAARARPDLLVSIAPPFRYFGDRAPPARPACPWLVVHGRDDEVVDYGQTRDALAGYEPPAELVTLDGVGHFFHGKLRELDTAVSDFIRRHPFATLPQTG